MDGRAKRSDFITARRAALHRVAKVPPQNLGRLQSLACDTCSTAGDSSCAIEISGKGIK
jgi:hypothetical protein